MTGRSRQDLDELPPAGNRWHLQRAHVRSVRAALKLVKVLGINKVPLVDTLPLLPFRLNNPISTTTLQHQIAAVKRPKPHHAAVEHRHQPLLSGIPDHLSNICLSLVPPSKLYTVCRSWRRLIYSPSFPPFLSLSTPFLSPPITYNTATSPILSNSPPSTQSPPNGTSSPSRLLTGRSDSSSATLASSRAGFPSNP
ncbi:hypothetical protein SASPL_133521 [Salvia splendens]|uniref:F-box domain-containing protein n=1 Tax=Salvia splendens TaxID=180675 RepID=A0A8X8ZI66_SALSN|nr:hypothetical protein SASPL_133521 [Salvia splendens]